MAVEKIKWFRLLNQGHFVGFAEKNFTTGRVIYYKVTTKKYLVASHIDYDDAVRISPPEQLLNLRAKRCQGRKVIGQKEQAELIEKVTRLRPNLRYMKLTKKDYWFICGMVTRRKQNKKYTQAMRDRVNRIFEGEMKNA